MSLRSKVREFGQKPQGAIFEGWLLESDIACPLKLPHREITSPLQEQVAELKTLRLSLQYDFKSRMIVHENSLERLEVSSREWQLRYRQLQSNQGPRIDAATDPDNGPSHPKRDWRHNIKIR